MLTPANQGTPEYTPDLESLTLRMKGTKNHRLTQNLSYNYWCQSPKHPIIEYMDPEGNCLVGSGGRDSRDYFKGFCRDYEDPCLIWAELKEFCKWTILGKAHDLLNAYEAVTSLKFAHKHMS